MKIGEYILDHKLQVGLAGAATVTTIVALTLVALGASALLGVNIPGGGAAGIAFTASGGGLLALEVLVALCLFIGKKIKKHRAKRPLPVVQTNSTSVSESGMLTEERLLRLAAKNPNNVGNGKLKKAEAELLKKGLNRQLAKDPDSLHSHYLIEVTDNDLWNEKVHILYSSTTVYQGSPKKKVLKATANNLANAGGFVRDLRTQAIDMSHQELLDQAGKIEEHKGFIAKQSDGTYCVVWRGVKGIFLAGSFEHLDKARIVYGINTSEGFVTAPARYLPNHETWKLADDKSGWEEIEDL